MVHMKMNSKVTSMATAKAQAGELAGLNLEQLRDMREKLDAQIRDVRQQERKQTMGKNYVRVVCVGCMGSGEHNDPWDDYGSGDGCDECMGRGYLWARKFSHKHEHDVEYDEQINGINEDE